MRGQVPALPNPADLRIGIVGAGCAGLTAAEELRHRGYSRVTVLESKKRAGGKVITVPFQNDAGQNIGVYEAGTVFVLPGTLYDDYARRYQMTIDYASLPRARSYDLHTQKVSSPFLIKSDLPLLARIHQLMRFMATGRRYARAGQPGFADAIFDNLGDSCSHWFTSHGLEFARDALGPLTNAMQFPSIGGPIPVAYLMKTLALINRLSLYRRLSLSFGRFAEGNQVLWQRVAEQQKVLFRTPVQRIKRGRDSGGVDGVVRVEVPQGEIEFDRLIWAAPMDEFPGVADASPAEVDVVSRIRHVKRAVVTCRIDGLPPRVCYFIKNTIDHSVPNTYPYAVFEVSPGSSVYSFYPYMHADTTVDELLRNVYDLARRLGGTRAKLVNQPFIWKWFPYFSVEDFKSGIYRRFEALQGEQRTYFVGEILAGIGVAFGMEYAADLIDRHFPRRSSGPGQTPPPLPTRPKVSPAHAFDLTLSGEANRPVSPPVQLRPPRPTNDGTDDDRHRRR